MSLRKGFTTTYRELLKLGFSLPNYNFRHFAIRKIANVEFYLFIYEQLNRIFDYIRMKKKKKFNSKI